MNKTLSEFLAALQNSDQSFSHTIQLPITPSINKLTQDE